MISFLHRGGLNMASYRYRCEAPAKAVVAPINFTGAEILVYCKPLEIELEEAYAAKWHKKIVVDFCDDHFALLHYRSFAALADAITCPTVEMAKVIKDKTGRDATIIPDCYEFDELASHCEGDKLLWFGHASNLDTLFSLGEMKNLRVISNFKGCIPWSLETTKSELRKADIFILPATKDYKSPNRAIEAIRMGCFVAADPHPSLTDFPIWKGGVKEGVEWALHNRSKANQMTREAQDFIRERFAPRILASAWKTVIQSLTTSEPERSSGLAGSLSISPMQTSIAT